MKIDALNLIDNISTAVFVAKPIYINKTQISDFEICYTNKAMQALSQRSFILGAKWSLIKDRVPSQVPWFDLFIKAIEQKPLQNYSFFSPKQNAWFKVTFSYIPKGLVSVSLSNITTEMNYARRLKEAISKDPLTGLSNRTGFSDDLDITIENCRYKKLYSAVFILDIDDMKIINDSIGSKEGDNVIIKVSEILKHFQRENITCYRYGDDEFAVIISNQKSLDSILTITDTIFECFQMREIKLSGGVSVFPEHTEQKDEMIRFSNMAVHYSKQQGKNCVHYFEPEMQRKFIQKLTLQSKMTAAILDSNFKQYYQPQFDVRSGELRGFEALIRWFDEDLGDIPPSVFIPLAEETGLIIPIGQWVLKTAVATLKTWQDKYHFRGIISVNVSPIQLKQDNFIPELRRLIREYEINPALIEVEITEGVMIHNMEDAVEKLKEVKAMGVRVSLDDFGTGYSSLSYLQALPLNTLKIDKSFINDICSVDGVQANITSSIISMVTGLGLETIAEGVEDLEQFELLSKFNCNVIQGFLQGKPMPFDMCDKFLAGDKTSILKN